jgi:hypothetical protein
MYIGNDLQIAHPSYKIIDDISSGFNGSQTSFALQVSGATPVPFPISTQQVMISVNGVVQEPDPNGGAGFKLLGSNIVFSSAPANGHAFFGVINAGADYVTAGSEFPDGSATAPSFTFQDDQDTGWFRNASGDVGYSSNGSAILNFDGNGLTIAAGKGLTVDTNTLHVDAANNSVNIGTTTTSGLTPLLHLHKASSSATAYLHITNTDSGVANSDGFIVGFNGSNDALLFNKESTPMRFATAGLERMRIDSSGKVGIGVTSPLKALHVKSTGAVLRLETTATTGSNYIDFNDADENKAFIGLGSGGDDSLSVWNVKNDTVRIATNNTERMRIDSSGKVGIGTTSPSSIFHCRPLDETNFLVRNEGSNVVLASETNSGRDNNRGLDFEATLFTFIEGGSEKARLDSSGRLLLGTTTEGHADADDFTLAGTGNTGITIRSGASNYGQLFFSDGTSGADEYRGYVQYNHTANSLIVGSNGTAALTIDSSQNATFAGSAVINGDPTNGVNQGIELSVSGYIEVCNTQDNYYVWKGFKKGSGGGNGTLTSSVLVDGTATFAGTVSDSYGDLRSIPIETAGSAQTPNASSAGHAIYISTGGVTLNNSVFATGDAVTIINNSGSDQTITQGSGLTLYNTADASSGNRTLAGRGMATVWFASASVAYISGAGLS